jgi:hypothetical protein
MTDQTPGDIFGTDFAAPFSFATSSRALVMISQVIDY